MSECKFDFRTKTVGDGCEVCNPAKALEYAKETISDLREQLDAAIDALDYLHGMGSSELSAIRKDAERYRWLRQWAGCENEMPDLPVPTKPDEVDSAIDAAMVKP